MFWGIYFGESIVKNRKILALHFQVNPQYIYMCVCVCVDQTLMHTNCEQCYAPVNYNVKQNIL